MTAPQMRHIAVRPDMGTDPKITCARNQIWARRVGGGAEPSSGRCPEVVAGVQVARVTWWPSAWSWRTRYQSISPPQLWPAPQVLSKLSVDHRPSRYIRHLVLLSGEPQPTLSDQTPITPDFRQSRTGTIVPTCHRPRPPARRSSGSFKRGHWPGTATSGRRKMNTARADDRFGPAIA